MFKGRLVIMMKCYFILLLLPVTVTLALFSIFNLKYLRKKGLIFFLQHCFPQLPFYLIMQLDAKVLANQDKLDSSE